MATGRIKYEIPDNMSHAIIEEGDITNVEDVVAYASLTSDAIRIVTKLNDSLDGEVEFRRVAAWDEV